MKITTSESRRKISMNLRTNSSTIPAISTGIIWGMLITCCIMQQATEFQLAQKQDSASWIWSVWTEVLPSTTATTWVFQPAVAMCTTLARLVNG